MKTATGSYGVTRAQTWRFPGRADCITCHTPAGGHALSFNTRQLNRPHTFPGGTANLVTALPHAAYPDAATSAAPPSPTSLPAHPALADATAPLETRARAYLEVNCSFCHRPGGTALGLWDGRTSTPLSLAGLVDGPLYYGVAGSPERVLAPASPISRNSSCASPPPAPAACPHSRPTRAPSPAKSSSAVESATSPSRAPPAVS